LHIFTEVELTVYDKFRVSSYIFSALNTALEIISTFLFYC